MHLSQSKPSANPMIPIVTCNTSASRGNKRNDKRRQ